ncbi:DUF721 domain-containing protein [bacterium]|nr:DUF721 domain-containing protein [bacterium]
MAGYTRPEHIKSIVSNIISKIREKEGRNKTGEIKKHVIEILGKQSGRHVEVRELKKGSLSVRVDSSAWLQELNLMKQDLVNSINMKFKGDLIKEIKIRLGKK